MVSLVCYNDFVMRFALPKFNDIQLDRLSEIAGNLSLLFLATMVIPILTGEKQVDILLLILGIIMTFGSLVFSLLIIKRK